MSEGDSPKSWLSRITQVLSGEPQNREDLAEMIHSAGDRGLLDPDALRIIEATAKRLEMPMDRVIVTVDRHGNTSSGSVPLALDEAVRAGKIQRGQLVLLEAFGGGFTWGSALLRY